MRDFRLRLAEPGRGVATQHAHQGEEEHHRLQQAAPLRRRQEAQEGEDQGHLKICHKHISHRVIIFYIMYSMYNDHICT